MGQALIVGRPTFLEFTGQVHLIDSDQELGHAIESISKARELGFDTETRPSFKVGEVYPVSLLQLSTETDAFIVRLKTITVFTDLKNIFENENILKIGAAIRDDLRLLQMKFKFEPKGFIELQSLAKEKGLKNFGLKGMAEEVLGVGITKGPKLTNWAAETLTQAQLSYAATDAWVGLKIYLALNSKPN